MGKEVTLVLPFRKDGKQKSIDVKINFTSRGLIRDYESMKKDQIEFAEKVSKLKDYNYLIDDYKLHKPEDYKLKLKDLYDKVKVLSEEIMSFDVNSFGDRQIKLIKNILIDNLVDNEMLLNDEFWNRNVDINDMLDFLESAIHKDIDLKKKPIKAES